MTYEMLPLKGYPERLDSATLCTISGDRSMMASRRKLLFGAAALALAPAIARAENIMRIKPPTLILYGDGVHDDTHAMNSLVSGERVWSGIHQHWVTPKGNYIRLPDGHHKITDSIRISRDALDIDFGGAVLDLSSAPADTHAINVSGMGNHIRNIRVGYQPPGTGLNVPWVATSIRTD
jgi:hypothetical protein